MNEWVYSEADRCPACDNRAIIPNQEIATRFIMKSEGRLVSVRCPVGNGVHLLNPGTEFADIH